MNTDQAKLLLDYMTNLWEGEFPATCKVLAAVPEGGRTYRPDERSRTAWELTVHLATGDIWFMDAIAQGAFVWDPEAAKAAESQFTNLGEVVEFYKREFPARLATLRALPAEKLTQTVDFFGMMQQPNVTYLGFANNHSIHHRGQLASYLRAMGSKVPAIYGMSADEQAMAG